MKSYSDVKDEELIQRLRDGETEITDYIMDKYKNLVRKRANAMFLIGGENEDLIQEGMIGLFKAIRDYREGESSFYHFADLCISRQIYNAVEAAGRKKHQPLNSYVSLSDKENGDNAFFMDMLLGVKENNPEQLLIDRETMDAVAKRMRQAFSAMEQQVMELYLQGFHYRQIAEMMGKSPKAIDNALQRIKGKLSDMKRELR